MYAGLEFGAECYCGHKIQAPNASESECNMECKGEKSNLCGGANRLSIYRLELSQESARRCESSLPRASPESRDAPCGAIKCQEHTVTLEQFLQISIKDKFGCKNIVSSIYWGTCNMIQKCEATIVFFWVEATVRSRQLCCVHLFFLWRAVPPVSIKTNTACQWKTKVNKGKTDYEKWKRSVWGWNIVVSSGTFSFRKFFATRWRNFCTFSLSFPFLSSPLLLINTY